MHTENLRTEGLSGLGAVGLGTAVVNQILLEEFCVTALEIPLDLCMSCRTALCQESDDGKKATLCGCFNDLLRT